MDNLLTVVLLCYSIVPSSGGSMLLTASPPTATEGGLFTLTCGNRSSGSRAVNWYLNDAMAFSTNYEPGQHNNCTLLTSSSSSYRYMAERVTVSCDTHRHNLTLTINSTLDNGSVWFCENNSVSNVAQVTRARSVPLIIKVSTVRTSTDGFCLQSSTLETSIPDNNMKDIQNDFCMAAGGYMAAVGGAVVAAVVFVLAVLWVWRRFRNERQIDGVPDVPHAACPSTVDIYDSPSAPDDVAHQYCQVQGGAEAPTYVNTEAVKAATDMTAEGDTGDAHYYSCVGST